MKNATAPSLPRLNVYALPALLDPATLSGKPGEAAVVIDVLRATTTIMYALAAGAKEVVPLLEIGETLEMKRARIAAGEEPESILLGGERGGTLIDGFDAGNSPGDYTPERVGGKTLLFTTTNGTRAIHRVRKADVLILAGFVNAAAVVQTLLNFESIQIVCAGTDGQYTEEDMLLAGCLVERLHRLSGGRYAMNVEAWTVLDIWSRSFSLPEILGAAPLPEKSLARELRTSRGGKNLLDLGLDRDIRAASRIDSLADVPRTSPLRAADGIVSFSFGKQAAGRNLQPASTWE